MSEDKKKSFVGGQAVIEGVMMRCKSTIATAVRNNEGEIIIKKDKVRLLGDRYSFMKWPLIRGVVMLFEALFYGVKCLSFSAQVAGGEEESLSLKEVIFTIIFAVVMAVGLFIILPTYAAKFFHYITDQAWLFNLYEGILRLVIFLLYVICISSMKDIRRVFQYHGAEHKAIFAYEAGVPLEVESVQKYGTLHPRCGTNFLLIVMVISIFAFAFLGWPDLQWRILSRIILMPLIAGVSYEIIRYAGRSTDSSLVMFFMKPGLWLQMLTTREPDDSQVEVAIAALQASCQED